MKKTLLALSLFATFGYRLLALSFSNQELWISSESYSDPSRTGSLASPWQGGGTGELGSWLNYLVQTAVSTNVTIHLLPGKYSITPTNHNRLPYGVRIVGAGMHNTIVTMAAHTSSGSSYVFTSPDNIYPGNTNMPAHNPYIEITDLSIDCGYSALGTNVLKAGAINICANESRLERIKVYNYGAYGSSSAYTREVFGIIYQVPTDDVGHVTIRDCVVTGAVKGGSYANLSAINIWRYSGLSGTDVSGAITLDNVSGLIEGNKILDIGPGVGFNLGGFVNVRCVNNLVRNALGGAGADTGSIANLFLAGNQFVNVDRGITLSNKQDGTNSATMTMRDIMIKDNFIQIRTNYGVGVFSGETPAGIEAYGISNLTVIGNLVTVSPERREEYHTDWYSLYFRDDVGATLNHSSGNLIFLDNVVYPWIGNYVDATALTRWENNFYSHGTELPYGASEVVLSSSATEYVISDFPSAQAFGKITTISITDAATTAGTKTIKLPNPGKWDGKTIKLVLYKAATSNSVGWGINVPVPNLYTQLPLRDAATGIGYATNQTLTVVGASTAASYKTFNVTSSGRDWIIEKQQ